MTTVNTTVKWALSALIVLIALPVQLLAQPDFVNHYVYTQYIPPGGNARTGPVPIGQMYWYARGEYPAGSFPQVSFTPLNGTAGALPTQVNVTSRWPDGSIKSAFLAYVIPVPDGDVAFTPQATCNCIDSGNGGFTAARVLTDPVNAPTDFDFRVVVDPPVNNSGLAQQVFSARTALAALPGPVPVNGELIGRPDTRQPFVFHDGPIMSRLVIHDLVNRSYNMGYQPDTATIPTVANGTCPSAFITTQLNTTICPSGGTALFQTGDNITVFLTTNPTTATSSEVMRVGTVTAEGVEVFRGVTTVGSVNSAGNISSPTLAPRILTNRWLDPTTLAHRRLVPEIQCDFWWNIPSTGRYLYQCSATVSNSESVTAAAPVSYRLSLQIGRVTNTTKYTYVSTHTNNSLYHMPGQSYTLDQTDINTATIYSVPDFFWSQSDTYVNYQPPALNRGNPLGYLVNTKTIPPYTTSFNVEQSDISTRFSTDPLADVSLKYNNIYPDRNLALHVGLLTPGWPQTGGRPELGANASWGADCVAVRGGYWPVCNLAHRHATLHFGAYTIRYREMRNQTFNRGSNSVGRPFSSRTRPGVAMVSPWATGDQIPGALFNITAYNGPYRQNTSTDDAHLFDTISLDYYFTGSFLTVQTMWDFAGYATFMGQNAPSSRVGSGRGSTPLNGQDRSTGRVFQYIINARHYVPQGFVESNWINDVYEEFRAAVCGYMNVRNCTSYQSSSPTALDGVNFGQFWDLGYAIGFQHASGVRFRPMVPETTDGPPTPRGLTNGSATSWTINSQLINVFRNEATWQYVSNWMNAITATAFGLGAHFFDDADMDKLLVRTSGYCSSLPPTLPERMLCSIYYSPVGRNWAVTSTDHTTDTITIGTHNIPNGRPIVVHTYNRNPVLPGGLVELVDYSVESLGPNELQLRATSGVNNGLVIDITTAGLPTWGIYLAAAQPSTAVAATVNPTTNILTINGHTFSTGNIVRVARISVRVAAPLVEYTVQINATNPTRYRACQVTATTIRVCPDGSSTPVNLTDNGGGIWYIGTFTQTPAEEMSLFETTYPALGMNAWSGGVGSRTAWNDGYVNRRMGVEALMCIRNNTCTIYSKLQQQWQCYQQGSTQDVPDVPVPSALYVNRGQYNAATTYSPGDRVFICTSGTSCTVNTGVCNVANPTSAQCTLSNFVAVSASTGAFPNTNQFTWARMCYQKTREVTVNTTYEAPPGALTSNPSALSVSCTDTNLTRQLTVQSTAGTLTWSATESLPWLTLSSASGTTPANVTATFDCTGQSELVSGNAQLTSTANTHTVGFTLDARAAVVPVNPAAISFTNVLSETRTVQTRRWPTNLTITATPSAAWITASVSGGDIVIGYAAASLAVGLYTGSVLISGPGVANPFTIAVDLTVLPTAQVIPGANTIALRFDAGDGNRTCTLNWGTGDITFYTLSRIAEYEIAGLIPATAYTVVVTCNAVQVLNQSVTTLVSTSGARQVFIAIGKSPTTNSLLVRWGSTRALGSSQRVVCNARCEVTLTVPGTGPIWMDAVHEVSEGVGNGLVERLQLVRTW